MQDDDLMLEISTLKCKQPLIADRKDDGMTKNYRFIKDLVFDIIHQTNGKVDYETMTKHVLENFPQSKWKTTHWSWYKNQIKNGRFKDEFSAEEKKNLKLNKAVRTPLDIKPNEEIEENHVKRIGDNILNHVRMMIREIAKDDEDFEFKLNRWIYARLMSDERKKKAPESMIRHTATVAEVLSHFLADLRAGAFFLISFVFWPFSGTAPSCCSWRFL